MTDVPEMIERVARALCAARDCGVCRETKLHVCDAYAFRDDARAAIAAMLKPNKEMVRAARHEVGQENFCDSYHVMIDAALGNPPVAR